MKEKICIAKGENIFTGIISYKEVLGLEKSKKFKIKHDFCCVTGRKNVVGIISYKEVLGLENEEWRDDALAKKRHFWAVGFGMVEFVNRMAGREIVLGGNCVGSVFSKGRFIGEL